MIRGPTSYVYLIYLFLLCVSQLVRSSWGVAPGAFTNLCELSVCRCPLAYARVQCVCDHRIQEIVLQATGYDFVPNTVGSIEIEKCDIVTVARKSIKGIFPLRSVTLKNIGRLHLLEEAFYWDTTKNLDVYTQPGIDIVIENASISDIPPEAFKGHLNSITLRNVNITSIKPLAFANIAEMDKIEIINSKIEMVASQAFKKFIINSFVVEGGSIGMLPTYSMNGVQIKHALKFENVNFDTIRTGALKITDTKVFRLSSCNILQLEGEAFYVTTKGPFFIEDNIINQIGRGAFVGIRLDQRSISPSGKYELIFENNTFTKFEDNALSFNTTGIRPRIDRIIIDQQCKCSQINQWSTKLVKFTTDRTPQNFAKYIMCRKGQSDILLTEYESKSCNSNSSKVYLVVTILIIVLLSLICICSIGFWIFRRHTRRYMNVTTNSRNNRLSVLSSTSNHIIVIPESKIYRETELNVLTESVEPIKEYIAPRAISQHIQ